MPYDNSTSDPVEIRLTKGYVALVDQGDADLATMRWQVNINRGYICAQGYTLGSRSERKKQLMHRVILARMLGRSLSPGEFVDHIDMNALNNIRSNLRLATQAQNERNRRKHRDNTSGYKGVGWHKYHKKWSAQIGVDGKVVYLGYFDTAELAYAAYCAAAKKYHGDFARLE